MDESMKRGTLDLIKFKDFSFSFSKNEKIFSNINFTVKRGDFVLFCGPSGCGKTTLLMSLKNEIKPKGEEEGVIYYDGKNIRQIFKEKSAREIGFLFQNPENQFVCDTVIQEISFSLENMGLPTEEIRTRIAEISTFFSLDKLLYKKVDELSGGQKQLVNLCSLLVLKPKVLLLDEPTSQLDPIASYEFLSILRRLNEEFSITILMSEHRIDNIFPFIDKAIFIENKKIAYNNFPREICLKSWKDPTFSNYLPSTALIHNLFKEYYSFSQNNLIPINIREGLNDMYEMNQELLNNTKNTFYEEYEILNKNNTNNKLDKPNDKKNNKLNNDKIESIFKCENLYFGYNKNQLIIKDISFEIRKREFISILGGNGTGKSTLLQLLVQILKPIKGKIKFDKKIKLGYVHQNPMIHFSFETVEEELNVENNEKEELIDFFEIRSILKNHPYDCSGGEQQKLAIVKSLLTNPDILFLDEPTKGLDPLFKRNLGEKLQKLQKSGLTIVMVTHDIEFAADYSNRSFLIFDGGIQVDSTPKELFYNNNFYTTFTNRMVKNFIPKCITLKDLKNIWNKNNL
ncbi:ABC transporter ATP-binding protein [Methanobrevibacter sp.]|uniref:ABC transporter ATP-binding protein n=1 Tax=Methanobrevibacter sp. TaxID=66852 RepID=UPI002616F682|nr:ABC transporter ATP-binding protein [uncultured Methanobrevibacter sp.]